MNPRAARREGFGRLCSSGGTGTQSDLVAEEFAQGGKFLDGRRQPIEQPVHAAAALVAPAQREDSLFAAKPGLGEHLIGVFAREPAQVGAVEEAAGPTREPALGIDRDQRREMPDVRHGDDDAATVRKPATRLVQGPQRVAEVLEHVGEDDAIVGPARIPGGPVEVLHVRAGDGVQAAYGLSRQVLVTLDAIDFAIRDLAHQ